MADPPGAHQFAQAAIGIRDGCGAIGKRPGHEHPVVTEEHQLPSRSGVAQHGVDVMMAPASPPQPGVYVTRRHERRRRHLLKTMS
jgi:hypothetical protein